MGALVLSAVLLLLSTQGWAGEIGFLWRELPRHLAADAREAFWGRHLAVTLLAGGGLTAAARTQDQPFQRELRRRRYLGSADVVGDRLGQEYTQFGYVGLAYAVGRLGGGPEVVRTSELMLESLCLTQISTGLLKRVSRRDRPDGSNELSFPSLHAAGSFTLATTLQLRHGWRAGVPAGLLAAFVSFSRMQRDKHFASDSVFGAILGATIAHAVSSAHLQGGRLSATVGPAGARLDYRF